MRNYSRFITLLTLIGLLPLIMAMGPRDGSFVSGRFALELDGEVVGFVKSVDGGHIEAEVATHQLGPESIAKKHISNISYEDFTIEVDMNMSDSLYEWIQASFDKGMVRKSGAIIAADYNYKELARQEFTDALITEVTLPAMDGSSKEPAYMTIKFQPESIKYLLGSGEALSLNKGAKQKMWLASNFRVEIGDLPTDRVSKIDGFTIKQDVNESSVGRFREPSLEPTGIEFPNLTLYISMTDAQPWFDWFDSFAVNSNSGDDAELNGRLTWLGPDLEEELGSLDFLGMGIYKLDAGGGEANKENIAQFKVELYVEQMKLKLDSSDE